MTGAVLGKIAPVFFILELGTNRNIYPHPWHADAPKMMRCSSPGDSLPAQHAYREDLSPAGGPPKGLKRGAGNSPRFLYASPASASMNCQRLSNAASASGDSA